MPMFKYINDTFKLWTSIFCPIPRRKIKFSINFAAMLNLVRQIKSSLNRNPSSELLDIIHAQYTYTYLLTGRISKLDLHSLKSYTCVRITSWITLVHLYVADKKMMVFSEILAGKGLNLSSADNIFGAKKY